MPQGWGSLTCAIRPERASGDPCSPRDSLCPPGPDSLKLREMRKLNCTSPRSLLSPREVKSHEHRRNGFHTEGLVPVPARGCPLSGCAHTSHSHGLPRTNTHPPTANKYAKNWSLTGFEGHLKPKQSSKCKNGRRRRWRQWAVRPAPPSVPSAAPWQRTAHQSPSPLTSHPLDLTWKPMGCAI